MSTAYEKNEDGFQAAYILVEVNFVDMYHFQMYEGKFKVAAQSTDGHDEYIFANVSNFDGATFEESEIRIYSQAFEELYCAEDYELHDLYNEALCTYLKSEILSNVK